MVLSKLWKYLVAIILFLMIWATGQLIWLKAILCSICILIGVFRTKGILRLDKWTSNWTCTYIVFNLFFVLLAIAYNNWIVITLINIRFIEPILFFLLFSMIGTSEYDFLKKVLVLSSLFLYIYSIFGFLCVNGFVPISISYVPFVRADFGGVLPFGLQKADAEYTQWFYFLIPCSIALYFVRNKCRDIKRVIVVNFALAIIVAVLTLKTALIVVVSMSFVASFILSRFEFGNKRITRRQIILIMLAVCCCVIALSIPTVQQFISSTVLEKIRVSFGMSDPKPNQYGVVDSGSDVRVQQIKDLILTWKERPIFGWGDAANAKNVVRSRVSGAYEMVYFAKLMQRGLVGLSIYVLLIFAVYFKLFAIMKSKSYLSIDSFVVIVGYTSILIANGTNPYIEAFDKLIVIFIPLLIIKLHMEHRNHSVNGVYIEMGGNQ